MTKRTLAAATAVVVAAGAVAGALAMPSPSERARPKPFTVSGSVQGLYPGAHRPLRLVVRNPHPFAIRVTSLHAQARDASRECRGYELMVTRLRRPVVVPAKGARRVVLQATLLHRAPLACSGATFRLEYGGRAVRQ